jgi:hypothetical protein
MNEINNILKDESNNDKELIRELSVYIKNHRDKKLSVNKNFFKDIVDICLRNSEIDFCGIETIDNENLAQWNDEDGMLGFNITKILNTAKWSKKEWLSNPGDNRLFTYYHVLETIIHELTHARQSYLLKKEGNNIYNSCLKFICEQYDAYKAFHDDVLIERYADLRAANIAFQVLSYIYPQNQIKELRDIQFECLFDGYKIICDECPIPILEMDKIYADDEILSALDNYNEIVGEYSLPGTSIDTNEHMTLYDRLYLGLPISMLELCELNCLYYYVNEEREYLGDVKTLINRL